MKIKIGTFQAHINEICRSREISYAEAADKVLNMGIQNICVAADQVNYPVNEKKINQQLGLHISDTYGNLNFITEKEYGGSAETLIEKSIDMGAERLLITTNAFTNSKDIEQCKRDNEKVIKGLQFCVDKVRKSNIKIVIEDYDANDGPFTYAGNIKFILTQVPEIYFAYDSGNFVHTGEDEVDQLIALKEYLGLVHFKDRADQKYLSHDEFAHSYKNLNGTAYFPCPIGSGFIRFKEISKILQEENYRGMIIIEHFDASDQFLYLQESIKYVRKLFDKKIE